MIEDRHGMPVHVKIMPYSAAPHWSEYRPTICIQDVDGRLVPVDAANARRLAKALKRAAKKMESA